MNTSNPYRSPLHAGSGDHSALGDWSALVIRSAIFATASYASVFVIAGLTTLVAPRILDHVPPQMIEMLVIAHVLVMLINFTAFGFTVRDWRARKFESSKAKYWWLVAIVYTGGVGWIWYVVKFKLSRNSATARE